MTATKRVHVPWVLWPFWAFWKLVAGIVKLVGRLVAFAVGVALMLVGGLLTMTVIGAFAGIPLVLLGLLLVTRSLF